MPRFVKNYVPGRNVVEEAKARIRRSYDEFDFVSLSYSGGKDSLATLLLMREVQLEDGHPEKLHLLFLDEEVIHQDVINYVHAFVGQPWVDMHWWATPLLSHKFVLGRISNYIQWDPARDPSKGGVGWVRTKPPYAYTEVELADQIAAWQRVQGEVVVPGVVPPLSQYAASEVESMVHKGRYMQLCGMRCSESLLRYAMVSSAGLKPSECWIGMPTLGRVYLGKPIYDWSENDVFKYLHDAFERGLNPAASPYALTYDGQMYGKTGFRVGTALTSEAAGRLPDLRATDPDLYEAVQRLFPEMLVHERYHDAYVTDAEKLEASGELETADYDTIQRWIDANLDDQWHAQATVMLGRLSRRPDQYPPGFLYKAMVKGCYKRGYLSPDPKCAAPKRAWVKGRYVDVDDDGVPVVKEIAS